MRYFNLSLARCDSGHAESRYSPGSVDSSDTRRRGIWANGTRDGCSVPFCSRATCGGGHAHRCRAHCAAPVVPHSFASEAEVGPCRRNGAVRFVISGLRTNGWPKTGKSMRYNSRTRVRRPMPFRKHQVDCLRPWRLPSPWILKRILLAIFNIRTGTKRARACRGALSGRISSESGARGWLGASVRACFVKSNRAKGDPSTCGDARGVWNGCATGVPADAGQHAAPIPTHPSRRMRHRPNRPTRKVGHNPSAQEDARHLPAE